MKVKLVILVLTIIRSSGGKMVENTDFDVSITGNSSCHVQPSTFSSELKENVNRI